MKGSVRLFVCSWWGINVISVPENNFREDCTCEGVSSGVSLYSVCESLLIPLRV
jgi:hypothetical protein